MNKNPRRAHSSTDRSEDVHQGEPGSSQAEPTHWHALLERVKLAVAEINSNLELVSRALGGEGLTLSVDGDTLEVMRVTTPLMRLCVTNHEQSVSVEWVTKAGGGREGDGRRQRVLDFDTAPTSGLILRKESGASMVMDEAVRYLLTPLLMPQP